MEKYRFLTLCDICFRCKVT